MHDQLSDRDHNDSPYFMKSTEKHREGEAKSINIKKVTAIADSRPSNAPKNERAHSNPPEKQSYFKSLY
jgi:hypothetical protein